MLKYNPKIVPIIGRFFQHKNDIDIFVEGYYDEEFYSTLFCRIGNNVGLRIGKVIPVGSRKEVIDACLQDQVDRDRKRMYVIDGDLYLISDDNPKEVRNLYVHNSYCIENLLIEEDALIEILHDQLVVPKDKIKKTFTFENFLKFIAGPLIDLYLHYSIVFKVCPSIQTVSYGVVNLCTQKNKILVLDTAKISNRIEELKTEIKRVIPEEEYNEMLYSLQQKWPVSIDTLLTIVSGKDYLFPLIQFRIKKLNTFGTVAISDKSLRLRLAKLTEISRFDKISEALSAL